MTDRRLVAHPLEDVVAAAIAGGVDWVQLRERDLGGAGLVALADRIVAAARAGPRSVRVLVNRRCDVALACDADGVQLGFDALPVAAARALLGPTAQIGVSAHAPETVRAARAEGASHAQLAPIFAPLSKPAERAPIGLDAIRACADALPVLAQGGIGPSNAMDVIRAGAAGVAVTGAILGASDPEAAARALREALDRAAA